MLKGTLDDFALADIFRLASLARRTGKLDVVRSAGQGKVFIRDGEVYYAESSLGRELLGQKLIRAGALSESALMKALDENASTGRRVGEILVEGGAISLEQLEAALQSQIEDAVFDLLRWDLGEFTWEPGVVADVEVNIAVSVENLIIEASRRMDELEVIGRKIASVDAVLRMAPRPPEGAHEINITPEEWRMLVLVDGSRSVRDIAAAVAVEDFTALRALYGLVSAGLAEVTEGAEGDAGPGEAIADFVGGLDRSEMTADAVELPAPQERTPEQPFPPEALEPEELELEEASDAEAELEPEEAIESEEELEAEGLVSERSQLSEVPEPAEEPALQAEGTAEVATVAAEESSAGVSNGFDLVMDPGSMAESFDPLPGETETPVFAPESDPGVEPAGRADETVEEQDEPVFREEIEEIDVTVEAFDEPAPDELVAQGPADPFLSELLGDEGSGPAAEQVAVDETEPAPDAPEPPVVDRSAAVRELAGLFDDERPRATRDRPPAPEGDRPKDERRRVEDDDQLNKGLIGRLIDGVKGL